MGKKSILSLFKSFIASIGWKLFLWGNETTQEEYWEEIYQQELRYKNRIETDISHDEY